MTPVKAAEHVRRHHSVTAAIEKKALIWIAERLPPWMNSDHLSAIGLLAMGAAAASFAAMRLSNWGAAAVLFSLAANWFGDSLDGTLARVRAHQRPRYGYYVDHIIDVIGTTVLMGGLALSGLMTPWLAAAVLIAYLLVCAEVYLAAHAGGEFRMSFLGVGPTELRVLLAAGAIKAAATPVVDVPLLGRMLLFDAGGAIAAAGLAAVFVASAIRTARALYRAEPLPEVSRSRAA